MRSSERPVTIPNRRRCWGHLGFLGERDSSGWLVRGLFANALRRQGEGRYDDAVARVRQSMEALVQDRPRDVYGITKRSEIPAIDLHGENLPQFPRISLKLET